mgnify:CR=1 FL=1
MSNLPGMVIYMVKEGDNLWNIGKKYYIPVDSLVMEKFDKMAEEAKKESDAANKAPEVVDPTK